MNNTENQLDWLSSIAQLTKEKPEFVKEVLEKYNIRQSPSIGKPRRLNIKEIRFSGEKSGNYTDLFEFSFQNLNPGLWGLVSEGNLKGKTSILEIVRWLLRGKSSRNFQEGVKNWIKEASLEFLIDNIKYKVYLNQNNEKISGQLVEIPYTSQELVISSFVSEDEFEACMSEFMMKQLSLDFITAWRENSSQGEIGKFVRHDWSAISGVLFISTNYTARHWFSLIVGLKTLPDKGLTENTKLKKLFPS